MQSKTRDHKEAIIPVIPEFYSIEGARSLDYKAICCFAAIGFFLDDDSYFTNQKALQPATRYQFDEQGKVLSREKYFNWHYTPRQISFDHAVEEFSELFEKIIQQHTVNQKIILPISGGLDSRTLAAAVQKNADVFSYSYEFLNGTRENYFGSKIAKACGFPFEGYTIPNGYLWNCIKELALINGCYADFTNPRQMAVLPRLKDKGNIFLLGHWGDVLFDDMGVSGNIDFDTQVETIKKKILKKGGTELAMELWKSWDLPGSFLEYFDDRIRQLMEGIQITDANARIRAFKSMYWAPRWTSANLTIFKSLHHIEVPYYHDELCKFICTVPEEFLSGRKIQIEYLKRKAPQIAAVPWQKYYPCNLYNYREFDSLPNLARRAVIKSKRMAMGFMSGNKLVTRNWELQFMGESNDRLLQSCLLDDPNGFIPRTVKDKFYQQFKQDPLDNVHPLNMLLTLSLFNRLFFQEGGENGR